MKDLALCLPDLPRWVETRSLLLSGHCTVFAGGQVEAGYAVQGTRTPLVCIVGRPDPGIVREAAAGDDPERRVIAPLAAAEYLAGILPDWISTSATIHLLGPGAGPFTGEADARIAIVGSERAALFARLPAAIREELAMALPDAPMTVAFAGEEPAAVCYACWETETLWDVSIDTLEPFRRRGFAERCSAALISHMLERGKEPVWGAEDWNVASLRLAAKLGFVPVDRMAVLAPPQAP